MRMLWVFYKTLNSQILLTSTKKNALNKTKKKIVKIFPSVIQNLDSRSIIRTSILVFLFLLSPKIKKTTNQLQKITEPIFREFFIISKIKFESSLYRDLKLFEILSNNYRPPFKCVSLRCTASVFFFVLIFL